MSAFLLSVCSFQIHSGLMEWDVINKTSYKGLEMVIFELLFLSYMPTTLYFSVYHVNSIAMLYVVHKYKKKFESTNIDLTHSLILIFTSFFQLGGMVDQQFIKNVPLSTSCKRRIVFGHT